MHTLDMKLSLPSTPVLRRSAVCAAICAASLSSLHAHVLVSPELSLGFESIDPPGSRDVNVIAPGSTPKEELESMESLRVIQSFDGFEPGRNAIIFPDGSLPAVEITFETDLGRSDSGREILNKSFVTSGESGIMIVGSPVERAQTIEMRIDLGDSPDGQVFDHGAKTAAGMGFTIASAPKRLLRVGEITADFLSPDGGVLSSQTVEGLTEEANAIYFGYKGQPGEAIAAVDIRIEIVPGLVEKEDGDPLAPILGFDDLAIAPSEAP